MISIIIKTPHNKIKHVIHTTMYKIRSLESLRLPSPRILILLKCFRNKYTLHTEGHLAHTKNIACTAPFTQIHDIVCSTSHKYEYIIYF